MPGPGPRLTALEVECSCCILLEKKRRVWQIGYIEEVCDSDDPGSIEIEGRAIAIVGSERCLIKQSIFVQVGWQKNETQTMQFTQPANLCASLRVTGPRVVLEGFRKMVVRW